MDVRVIRYDHPDARKLDEEVQVEYAERYGEGDLTHMDAAHFEPPRGLYLIAYDTDGTPVASGGWRSQERSEEGYEDGDAEIKRMFVVRAARGRGWPGGSSRRWRTARGRRGGCGWSWRPAPSSRRPSRCTPRPATPR
ncbi:hypothetical protein SVIO_066050 [Streptomyces violaceusniger]|uniref:N-acetyltransferase domain-containing protein n=1 Tax=Streptomyces violaceusniger TaxID=68280 RepID=A0A4D4L4B4_STRVO|nr:hypothetical protein SVIO_066050 [Streptomyces violaceusniger]